MTPLRPVESAVTADRRTPNHAEEGVDAKPTSNVDVEASFPRYSHVTGTSSIENIFCERGTHSNKDREYHN